jgi:hypothetical protein
LRRVCILHLDVPSAQLFPRWHLACSYGNDSSQTVQNLALMSTVQQLLDLLGRQWLGWPSGTDILGCFESEVARWGMC